VSSDERWERATYGRSGDKAACWARDSLTGHGAHVARVAGRLNVPNRPVHCGASARYVRSNY